MHAWRQRAGWLLSGSVALAWPSEAAANGKFPAADQLVVDPSDPSHLVARTTFGILTSRNAGADWDLICEDSVGYANYEPGIAITPTGTVIAALVDGASVSSADQCAWTKTLTGNVQDVSVSRAEPGVSVAIRTAAVTQYLESTDDGQTFEQVGVDLPPSFIGVTVDVAPTDPARIYVSGLLNVPGGGEGKLARSIDRGQTWELFDIPDSDDQSVPYIGAVDPTDPATLYVRLFTAPGRLLGSNDGGQTWNEASHGIRFGVIRGLALSPDGQTVMAGSEFDGLWRAPASTLAFQQISPLAVRCLTWTSDALYACVNEFLYGDGFMLGKSTNAGATFAPLLRMSCVRGILECPSDTSVGTTCPALWPALSAQLDTDSCAAGGQGGGPISDAGAGAATGAPPASTPPSNGNGCSCDLRASERNPLGGGALAVSMVGLLLAARRRRVGRMRAGPS